MNEDDWGSQEDPRALEEKDYGRYKRKPTVVQMQGGSSELYTMMTRGSNHVRYKPKHGSSRNGTRYTYRKGSKV